MPNIKIKYVENDSTKEETYRNAQVIPVPYVFVDLFNVKTNTLIKRFLRSEFVSVELLRPATNEQITDLINTKTERKDK